MGDDGFVDDVAAPTFMMSPWEDAWRVAAIVAINTHAAGGVIVRARTGPVREHWLSGLRALLEPAGPVVRLLPHDAPDAVFGGLDLAATLLRKKPVSLRGLVTRADGGILTVGMAERLPEEVAAGLCQVIDNGSVLVQREGLNETHRAQFGIVALDESVTADEVIANCLSERIPAAVELEQDGLRDLAPCPFEAREVAIARTIVDDIHPDEALIEGLTTLGLALGIRSLRPVLAATWWSRASAALGGRRKVSDDDVEFACRSTLFWRATQVPQTDHDPADVEEPPASPETEQESSEDAERSQHDNAPDEVAEAARAHLPDNLLELLDRLVAQQWRAGASGRTASTKISMKRGRPAGVRAGRPGRHGRLNIVATLRAASPWQRVRANSLPPSGQRRIDVRPDDFRITRYREHLLTTTIFAVDASGSAAAHRLAEAKGAIELLLAESYVRRDKVALLAFRGESAELLLPPTKSVARAKRCLSGIPGGGGTPLAAGLQLALDTADIVRASGDIPRIILLTDGRANIALDGSPGRKKATADALAVAESIGLDNIDAMLIDISPNPRDTARLIAEKIGGLYMPMPHAGREEIYSSISGCTAPRRETAGSAQRHAI